MPKIHPVIVLFLLVLGYPKFSWADGPDFFLMFGECSSVIGYLEKAEYPLKKFDLGGSKYSCTRTNRKFLCDINFQDGSNPITGQEYELVFEVGTAFDLRLANYGDYISVNTNSHTAVVLTRAIHEKFLGGKVCRGVYMTADEAEHLSKNTSKESR